MKNHAFAPSCYCTRCVASLYPCMPCWSICNQGWLTYEIPAPYKLACTHRCATHWRRQASVDSPSLARWSREARQRRAFLLVVLTVGCILNGFRFMFFLLLSIAVTLRLVSERACSGQNLTFSCEAPTAETRILVWMITALPDVPAMPNSFGQSLGNTFERITSPDSIAGPNPSIITILNATAVDSGATVQCRIVNGDLSNVINLSIRE